MKTLPIYRIISVVTTVLILASVGLTAEINDSSVILKAGNDYTLADVKKEVGSNEIFDYNDSTKEGICRQDMLIKGSLVIGLGETLKMDTDRGIRVESGGRLKVTGTKEARAEITSIEGSGYTFFVDARAGGFEMRYAKLSNCGQGPLIGGAPTQKCGLYILGKDNVMIENCIFTNNYAGLIVDGVGAATGAVIRNNKFSKNKTYGLALHNARNVTVTENIFLDNGDGIYLNSIISSKIIKNNLENSGGIDLLWKDSDNTVSDNQVINARKNAFQVRTHCANNLFENNKAFSAGRSGFYICDSNENTIRDSLINKCYHGVFFTRAKDNKLVGCKIVDSQNQDIQLTDNSHNECINTEFNTLKKKVDETSTLNVK
jgi:parallel beta-helix repeat protein